MGRIGRKLMVVLAWLAVAAVAVEWARSRRRIDSLRHVYTKVPGAVGHYQKVDDMTWWIPPATRATEFCAAGGYVLFVHSHVDGAPIGWRFESEPFRGFDGPLPVNRLGFARQGGDVIVPFWAVLAVAVGGVAALHPGPRLRSTRRRGFPVDHPGQ